MITNKSIFIVKFLRKFESQLSELKLCHRPSKDARETQLDAQEFSFEMANMDWDSYMEKYWLGIRTFVLLEDLSSLPKARKKLQQIVWTKRIFQMILCALFYYAIFHGFGK